MVPPAKTASVSRRRPRSGARDRTITRVKRLGRRRWKKASGYQRQARVENAVFRYKSIIGDGLRARTPGGRQTETLLACNVLNRMTELVDRRPTASVAEIRLHWIASLQRFVLQQRRGRHSWKWSRTTCPTGSTPRRPTPFRQLQGSKRPPATTEPRPSLRLEGEGFRPSPGGDNKPDSQRAFFSTLLNCLVWRWATA